MFAPNGRRLATIAGPEIRIWDVDTGESTALMRHEKDVIALAFAADSERVWSAGQDGTARLWDVVSGKEQSRLVHGGQWPNKMNFSPGARFLAVALNDTTVWELATGKRIARMSHPEQAYDVELSPDGRYVATSAGSSTHVWEVSTTLETANLRHENTVWDAEFSHSSRWLITASADGTARLWDVRTGRELARMVHANEVWKASVDTADAQIATVSALPNSEESVVRVWRTAGNAAAFELRHLAGWPHLRDGASESGDADRRDPEPSGDLRATRAPRGALTGRCTDAERSTTSRPAVRAPGRCHTRSPWRRAPRRRAMHLALERMSVALCRLRE
jgi:WD40 repeat protein